MSNNKMIRWGIVGCGNVTEMKSGPAFNKVANSSLVAEFATLLKAGPLFIKLRILHWWQ